MNNYIEIKVAVWQRFHFDDRANMQGLADIIKDNGIEEIIDEKLGFVGSEELIDTEIKLNPSDNDGKSTIEVYQNRNIIWQNGKDD